MKTYIQPTTQITLFETSMSCMQSFSIVESNDPWKDALAPQRRACVLYI